MDEEINELVQELELAKALYYRGNPIMSDDEFDALELQLKQMDPDNLYFKKVGSPERDGKVKLRVPMGSLDQVYQPEEITNWINKLDINPLNDEFVVSAKLDGNSIQIIYNEFGELSQAITRGDGTEGKDVTRHVKRAVSVPKKAWPSAIVRCEAIIAKDKFTALNSEYKNPRNYVAGQLNRTTADQDFVDNVSFVAFDADLGVDKALILTKLKDTGFEIPVFQITNSISSGIANKLITNIEELKASYPYEIDGLVIELNSAGHRQRIGFDGLNPAYARKFKVNLEFVEVNVVGVHWAVSKHGYLKPRVEIEPVDLNGVTITFATGHNAKNIIDKAIGPGAIIKITRSGDVIPYIVDVIKPTEQDKQAFYPSTEEFGEYDWNETGVDLVVKENNSEMEILQNVDFFTGIDAPLLKEGNVRALYEAGFTTIASIIKASEADLVTVLGENGFKVYKGLQKKLQGIEEWKFAGSTSFFGRGIGHRKIKKIFDQFKTLQGISITEIMDVEGFDNTSAVKVWEGLPKYLGFVMNVREYVSFKEMLGAVSGPLNGKVFVFTGVRSKDGETKIESLGGKVANSFTSEVNVVVAKDPNGKSGKLDKARSKGVEILSLEDLWTKYLTQ
jgi:DNA ligase (NAD+)